VLLKNVEPWTVVGGNPAKFIKKEKSMISALILTFNEEIIYINVWRHLILRMRLWYLILLVQTKQLQLQNSMEQKYSNVNSTIMQNNRNEALKSVSESSDWILMVDAD